jgi:hypothetical protein
MDMPPYITDDQRRRDNDQIHLLAIFHFVLAGLMLLGMGFLCLHYFALHYVFSHPEIFKTNANLDAPKAIFAAFIWFYLLVGFIAAVACVANILSGVFLWQRRNRMFSLVVAGLDCLQIPFGTALGVFTFIVLLRDSVRQSYPA